MEIFVGNLPANIQMEELNHLFQYYGKILFIDIKKRCSPQFAFILFDNNGSAFNAVQASQNLVYNGHILQVRLLTQEEPNQSSTETAAIRQGTFQSQFSNQLAEHDKLAEKKKSKEKSSLCRTLTVVKQTPADSTKILNISEKRDKSSPNNNIQMNALTQRATIKILTPEVINRSVIDKEKSEQQKLRQNKKILQKVSNKRSSKIPPIPPLGKPGGFDDPYRKGLTSPGIKWYLRYLSKKIPQKEARIKAGAHTHLARGVSEKEARYLSEKRFNSIFGKK